MKKSKGIFYKIFLTTMVMLIFFGLITTLVIRNRVKNALLMSLKEEGKIIGVQLSQGELEENSVDLKNRLRTIQVSLDNIEYLYITDLNNRLEAHTFPKTFPGFLLPENESTSSTLEKVREIKLNNIHVFEVTIPISNQEKPRGYVHIGFTTQSIYFHLNKIMFNSLLVVIALILIGVFVLVRLINPR